MIKIFKVISTVVIFMLILFLINIPIAEAYEPRGADASGGSSSSSGDNFDFSKFEDEQTVPEDLNNLTENTLGAAISVVRIVSIGIALVVLMIIACKYMLASAGDRADIKKNAVPFVIGAFVVFGSNFILTTILEFSKTI